MQTFSKLWEWMTGTPTVSTLADATLPVTWSSGAALSPILPPSVPGSVVSLADAVKCPPVARALGLYASAMLRLPWTGPESVLSWLQLGTGPVSARLRDVRTVTDLVMVNRALWILDREGSTIRRAVHLDASLWSLDDDRTTVLLGGVGPDADGDYLLHGQVIANTADLVYFPGAMPMGLLEAAGDTIGHYRDLATTVKTRGRTPMPLVELAVQDDYDGPAPGDLDYDATTDPILQAQKAYADARRSPEGAVTVTPRGVKLNIHRPEDDAGMLLEARNAVRLDVANHCNINAAMLDGNNGTSDTYSNTLQNRNEFLELSLALFTGPLVERLNLEDVNASGERVELDLGHFDTSQDAKGNTGAAVVGIPQAGSAG